VDRAKLIELGIELLATVDIIKKQHGESELLNQAVSVSKAVLKKLRNMGVEIDFKRGSIYSEVSAERTRQLLKWGEQNHNPAEWLMILGEEVGEVNKASLEAHFSGYKNSGDYTEYRNELIQVAAVAVAMVECLDRTTSLGPVV